MKFIDKYPEGPREFKVQPEKVVAEGVVWTGRWYACLACGVRSPFRVLETDDCAGVPCCSEECAHAMIGNLLEGLGEQIAEDLKSSGSSLAERSPDTGEVAGSIPSPSKSVLDQIVDLSKVEDIDPASVTFTQEDIDALCKPE